MIPLEDFTDEDGDEDEDDEDEDEEDDWKVRFVRLPSPPHLVWQWSETHWLVVALSLLPHLIIIVIVQIDHS